MDSSAFRNFGFGWLFSWPVLAIFGIGVLTLVVGALASLWWLVSHLQWVW